MGAPDEFHPEAHEQAREITGERQYGEWGQCIATASSTGDRCRGYAKGPHGKCGHHGGSTPTKDENPAVGAPEKNTNAATHGAYAESFVENFLTDDEIERVEQAQELLGTPEGAQAHARLMASIAIEQHRRSGDDRFLRRYEAICDKAGLFPDDVQKHEHTGEGGGPLEVVINRERYDGDE